MIDIECEEIVRGFIVTALWCEEERLEEEAKELERKNEVIVDLTVNNVSLSSLEFIERIANEFLEKAGDAIGEFLETVTYYYDSKILNKYMALGSDLFLNINGHGAGFWERDGKSKDALSEVATGMTECHIYIGDDGKIEFC